MTELLKDAQLVDKTGAPQQLTPGIPVFLYFGAAW
jgi:hypothetical protein